MILRPISPSTLNLKDLPILNTMLLSEIVAGSKIFNERTSFVPVFNVTVIFTSPSLRGVTSPCLETFAILGASDVYDIALSSFTTICIGLSPKLTSLLVLFNNNKPFSGSSLAGISCCSVIISPHTEQ